MFSTIIVIVIVIVSLYHEGVGAYDIRKLFNSGNTFFHR